MANTSTVDVYGTGPLGVAHPAYNPAVAVQGSDLMIFRQGVQVEDGVGPVSLMATYLRTTGLYGTAGQGISIKEGTNARMGRAVLVGGASSTILVSNTSVTANTEIFLTINVASANIGTPYISARVPGASFTINSTNIADTSTISWLLIEPAP